MFISTENGSDSTGITMRREHERHEVEVHTQTGTWELSTLTDFSGWSHVVITWNEIGELGLYCNGKFIQRTSFYSNMVNFSANLTKSRGNTIIFGKVFGEESASDIQISDVMLFNYELLDTSVANLYKEGKIGFTSHFYGCHGGFIWISRLIWEP